MCHFYFYKFRARLIKLARPQNNGLFLVYAPPKQLSLGAAFLPLTRGLLQKLLTSACALARASDSKSSKAFQLLLNPNPQKSSSTRPATFLLFLRIKKKGAEKIGRKIRSPQPRSYRSLIFSFESNHGHRQKEKMVFRRFLYLFLWRWWILFRPTGISM